MKHEHVGTTVTRTSLVVHFRCIGPEDAWVRFATLRIPLLDLEPETIAELGIARLRLDNQQRAQQEMLY